MALSEPLSTMTFPHTAYISIGSNMGDKLENCGRGVAGLDRSDAGVVVAASSPFYRTEPVDYTDQDWFVNAVVKVETRLDPPRLLKEIQAIERDAGRVRGPVRFGPRTLDMDILLYDDLVVREADLEIPHPRMHKRRFVLRPICDIDASIVHPLLKSDMRTLLESLQKGEQEIIRL